MLLCSVTVAAQEQAVKVDELFDTTASDARERLNAFAQRLASQPGSSAVLFAQCPQSWPMGTCLRLVHGYGHYLVKSRGLAPTQIRVELAETSAKFRVELWFVPRNSLAPDTVKTKVSPFSRLSDFDSVFFGPGCEAADQTLALDDPADVIRFFGTVLKENPELKGLITVHPPHAENNQKAKAVFDDATNILVKQHGISADRLLTTFAGPRTCGELKVWVVTSSFSPPAGQTADRYLRSRLMSEADGRYTVRFVVFDGNRYTRDNILRRELAVLREGEPFTVEALRRDLANVSRLPIIHPIEIDDVDVSLNRADAIIDLTLFFRERPSARLKGRR